MAVPLRAEVLKRKVVSQSRPLARLDATPSVTIAVPVLNEERSLDRCLDAVSAQTYAGIVEVFVIDGGSVDATRELVRGRGGNVTLIDNPRRVQAAGLNVALSHAQGEVFVRVDGHCVVEPDYVERCVEALLGTGAAMVGGGMRPVGQEPVSRGIASAMCSPLGAGPARFHIGGTAQWVDTVYLGAFRTELAKRLGGYAEDVGVNEDAEFAIRVGRHGGVWFDPAIRSTYTPRSTLTGLVRQFYRYGRSRSATVRRHPQSLALRQLASPVLVLGLATPWRRLVAAAYAIVVLGASVREMNHDRRAAARFPFVLPAMHLSWGAGFLGGLIAPIRSQKPDRSVAASVTIHAPEVSAPVPGSA